MPMKQARTKTYKTFQGKSIDLDSLRKRNELTPAVGNVPVNARGDELGKGGKIVKKREDVIKEYYSTHSNTAVEEEISKEPSKPKKVSPAPQSKKVTRAQQAVSEEENWVEDDQGNFVKKED